MSTPCKDCSDRVLGCHVNCERYLKFKEKRAEADKRKRAGKKGYIEFKCYKKEKYKD